MAGAPFRFLVAGIACFASLRPVRGEANPNIPLPREYTLREPSGLVLERLSEASVRSPKPMSFIYPRPCSEAPDSADYCVREHGLTYSDTTLLRSISFSPEAGYEFRRLDEIANALEFGALATGYSGPVSFAVDARMYTEFHEDADHPSFDREFVERQDESASGSVAYSSYSRYRADLDYDFSWGRLSAGRDVVQWGPALAGNLVFNAHAIPFNQLSFTTGIGPLRVQTLYGQLSIVSERAYRESPVSRSVYAHRYELAIAGDWLLGVSEQLILSGYEEPFAFVPIIPLYIFKGDAWERLNNGSIAFDLTKRFPGWGRAYAEFLIDDMQSPTSLFDDQEGNKWAACVGVHAFRKAGRNTIGGVLEAARIEPWVYTHYEPATAQAANQGYPLGNPEGPNSLSIMAETYLRSARGFELTATGRARWKGTDSGSSIEDTPGPEVKRKTFLGGGVRQECALQLDARYAWRKISLAIEGVLASSTQARISLFYRL